ncbi:MAG: hypothetical protein ACRDSJ_02130 [Rubrobacteraceae bacterium]
MNPHEQFCHNKDCRAYAREGEGHIVIHSRKEQRYQCKRRRRTFSATKGTALYRMHKPKELLLTVVRFWLTAALFRRSSRPSVSMSERWRAGSERPGCNAGGYTSTWWRPGVWSWGKFRPTNCG